MDKQDYDKLVEEEVIVVSMDSLGNQYYMRGGICVAEYDISTRTFRSHYKVTNTMKEK